MRKDLISFGNYLGTAEMSYRSHPKGTTHIEGDIVYLLRFMSFLILGSIMNLLAGASANLA